MTNPSEHPIVDYATPPKKSNAALVWTGRVLSAIVVLFMGVMSTGILFFKPDMVLDGMVKYGYPRESGIPILITEIMCAVIYAVPQTAFLGAILLTGYLGGAVATHVHAGEPFFFPIIFGVIVWLGLFLRDARLRALVPWRR